MIELLLALLGVVLVIIVSVFAGVVLAVAGIYMAVKEGKGKISFLACYDTLEDKVVIVDQDKFEYKIFDK